MCPPGMVEAAVSAADKCELMEYGSDPIVAAVNGYYSYFATGLG